ncbi:winged helix-turn-helix domain-containing protein [Actinopolymorpha pittospori]|uniref:DNA-binding response OmpR family regulator n=1 Tax=Actinopolymorpha pittospori TaxID=648752 RepID=A0A927MWE4_9ACTN|nr:winged helix-turn-helix domain-containing protein [Actinopolymorpha pittospori]MBE1607676.1 DNA-binding response OmpR family regulator [Actinopolymorpha pittospori]
MHDFAIDKVLKAAPTTGLVLCVGLGADLRSAVIRSVGDDTAVLVVANAESALRVLAHDPPPPPAAVSTRSLVEFGPLRLDESLREASWHARPIELSARQFDLLATLARAGDRVWSFAELTETVWQRPYVGDLDAVASAVKRLRRRLNLVTGELTVASVRGVGYRLALLPTPLHTATPRGATA